MSNTWGQNAGGSGTIEDSGEAAQGGTLSRLIIKVPNYDGGSAVSYIRLGAVPTIEEPGQGLAELVKADPTATPPEFAFIDDNRDRDGGGVTKNNDHSGGHNLSQTARKAMSATLHTKGGWRDHSDGNRITTTYGDKVEVIRGNYKLLVLGRQDDPEKAAAYDLSGGLIQSGDIAPGSVTEIKWVRDVYDGTWHVLEEAQKGHQSTVYHGNVEDTFYGEFITSTTGSEDPTRPINLQAGSEATRVRANPTIVEKTWASKITSHTGSAKTPVPSITDITHAAHITSSTNCVIATDHTNALKLISTTVAGSRIETTNGVTHVDANVTALKLEAYAGVVVSFYGGLKLEVELSGKVAMSGPLSLELTWGKNTGIHNFKDEMKVTKTELITAMDTKINTAKTEITSATDTKISTAKTEVTNATNTEIGRVSTKIDTVSTDLSDFKTYAQKTFVVL